MKCFKVVNGDLYAVSLVEDPAIESTFIALSKNEVEIKLENEKRIITGAALIPNKPIYRNIGGREFYISFDEEAIEKLAQGYLDSVHTVTTDHNGDVNDVIVIESWIKTSDNDKSVSLGLNEPIGTWFISMKVNNDEIWQKIKDGIYKGFSIEAIVGLDEIITNNVELSMDKTFVERLKELIYEALGQNPSADEIINEVVKDVQEKQPIELDAKDEEIARLKEDVANLSAEVERIKSERDELESRLSDITAERDQLAKEKEELNAENVKLSKQPSVEPNKTIKINDGKNYKAAVSFMLK